MDTRSAKAESPSTTVMQAARRGLELPGHACVSPCLICVGYLTARLERRVAVPDRRSVLRLAS